MSLSREARLMAGLTLILVPTIIYGGLFLLGNLTHGAAGVGGGQVFDATKSALFRAGHAHAGVWIVFSLLIQVLLDSANLSKALKWLVRLAAPIAALAVSIGFFGLAGIAAFRWSVYLGGLLLTFTVLTTAVGLLRRPA